MKSRVDDQNDIPVSVALMAVLCVGLLYLYLNYLRHSPQIVQQIISSMEANASVISFWFCCLFLNIIAILIFLQKNFGLKKQGRKLELLDGKKTELEIGRIEISTLLVGVGIFFLEEKEVASTLYPILTKFVSPGIVALIKNLVTINVASSAAIMTGLCLSMVAFVREKMRWKKHLGEPDCEKGELILGTTSGELRHASPETSGEIEEWVSIPSRGLNGGVLISGSPGSGKTQGGILRYLSQIVSSEAGCPAILAIDPKRTFLLEAEEIVSKAGLSDKIVKITLNGSITFNPVFVENALKNSRFIGLAEMVRASAVNFMGKSTDSPFWDISSANLIKNTIVYCAAVHGYFTLLDLYRVIVRASKNNPSLELREALKTKIFDAEEKFNIERAIEYFESEYLQMEDRVRSGIVATSTAFINQFQEFAASRILCPSKDNLTIHSMEELIKEGKILLFDINQPGLARSMGTFIKLHFQQAVLNMLPELKNENKPVTTALIIDEYQDVVSCGGSGLIGDDSFIAKARESKPAVIMATQSVSSLMDAVGGQRSAIVLIQNFRTRIACHSSDPETIKMFQELAGKEDREFESHSLSETSQEAKRNIFVGGFESNKASLNESISRAKRREDLVTGKEFSRLRTFEAFAQVFDGVDTRFMRLYLKPSFLKKINTRHEVVLKMLKGSK